MHLWALTLSRTHRALTRRALGFAQDLALALDIIIVIAATGGVLRGLQAKRGMLYPTALSGAAYMVSANSPAHMYHVYLDTFGRVLKDMWMMSSLSNQKRAFKKTGSDTNQKQAQQLSRRH